MFLSPSASSQGLIDLLISALNGGDDEAAQQIMKQIEDTKNPMLIADAKYLFTVI